MTEAEWLAATDPTPMLEFLRGKVSDRKLRLFGNACCRRIWAHLGDPRSRSIVVASERFVEDEVGADVLNRAFAEAAEAREAAHHEGGDQDATESVLGLRGGLILSQVIEGACESVAYLAVEEAWESIDNPQSDMGRSRDEEYEDALESGRTREKVGEAGILRDVFGPLPFRPIAVDPSWLTSATGALARGIYEERAFDRLPVLADALEDAGCSQDEILSHCRGGGPHVRGCWVVDLVLGKA
ncbi:MAG TPA: hypothetical protein VH092_35990 [Urbifossiella sp.]|nr:hypothetical protein [Urbifossiella sp.]